MQRIPEDTLSLVSMPDKDGIEHCQVTLPNGAVTVLLDGKCLEACVATGREYFLLLTNDVPFEETLHVYLVSASGVVLDSASLGACYTPAWVTGLVVLPPDRIAFAFFGDDCWRVTRYASPKRRWLPWRWGPRFVRRPWRCVRYFDLHSVADA